MALSHGRAVALPYGFEVAGRDVRVFNREYGVLAGFRLRRRPSRRQLDRMDWRGAADQSGDVFRVWFYADGCLPIIAHGPANAADTAAYFERLARFGRMLADERYDAPWPWPDHTLTDDVHDQEVPEPGRTVKR